MSKPRVDWNFQEVVASSKLDQMTVDWMRGPHLVIQGQGSWDPGWLNNNITEIDIGSFPFDPATCVFNRLRVYASVFAIGGGITADLRYTLDSGSSFTILGAGVAQAFRLGTPMSNFLARAHDIDLSAIASLQYVGLRVGVSGVPSGAGALLSYNVQGFLYHDLFPPF